MKNVDKFNLIKKVIENDVQKKDELIKDKKLKY